MHLHWQPAFSTSCLHAADAISRGWPVVDARLVEALQEPALALSREIQELDIPEARCWRQLLALSAEFESNRDLAEFAVRKTVGGTEVPYATPHLAGRIDDLENAMLLAVPKLQEELVLRVRPLQEQWEARGPGLLKTFANLTDESLLVDEAKVLLVHPVLGGGGDAHLTTNAVRIEAVLANPHPQLPEVVRLAWLLAQLNCDLPAYSEHIHADRLPHVVRLAILPAILQAAEVVELVPSGAAAVKSALELWRFDLPADLDAVTIVQGWWQTYHASRPRWPVALTALDRLLG